MNSLSLKYTLFLKITIGVLLLFLFFNPGEKESEEMGAGIELQSIGDRQDIRNNILILKNPTGNLTIEDVSRVPGSWGFMPVDERIHGAGLGEKVFWLEFTFISSADSENMLLVMPRASIQQGTLYTPEYSGGFSEERFTSASPAGNQGFSPIDAVFNLEVSEAVNSTFYMKIRSDRGFRFPVQIWDETSYRTAAANNLLVTGIFAGVYILLLLYCIHRYFIGRRKTYLPFLLFASAILVLAGMMTDYTILNIFPSLIRIDGNIMLLMLGAANIFGSMYLYSFLKGYMDEKILKLFRNRLVFMALLLLAVQFASIRVASVFLLLLTAANLIYSLTLTLKSRKSTENYIQIQAASCGVLFISLVLFSAACLNWVSYYGFFGQAIIFSLMGGIFLSALALYIKGKAIEKEKEIRDNKMIQRLQMELESLKNLDASKNELLEVTAHSMRTPLYGMIGLAESLVEESRGRMLPNHSKQMETLIDYGKKMADKLNDLTDFSRIKQNGLDIHVESVSIHQLIDEVLDICRPLLENRDIRLYSTLTKGLPEVAADPYRIQQILYNLLDNAINHTREGEIVVSAKKTGNQLMVSVRDTGSGIDRELLQNVFEPVRKGGSSDIGIGLSISKRLIELHGGWLRAESQKNSGTTFTFTLPLADAKADIDTSETFQAIEEIDGAELEEILGLNIRSSKKVKVLVAEKEPLDRNILIYQLQKENYDVIGTGLGSEAFQMVAGQPFDLLIVDWSLEDMSGIELCRELREKYVMTELPILMLSTKIGLQEKMDAFNAGANDYLIKPCDKEEFLLRVATLSNLKALTQEIANMNDVLERSIKEKTMALEITNMNLVTVNDEIQEIEKSRNEMLSSISHELGTPITLIHSYIQAVQESLIDEKNPRYLDMIHKKLLLLERLTEDLVELGKYKSGNMTLRFENVLFIDWFKKIIAGLEADIRQSGRLFEYSDSDIGKAEKEGYHISLDEDRIDQVFSNIIWNAVKNTFSTDGKISVSAQLCLISSDAEALSDDQAEAEIIFTISDTGYGIPPEILPHIFDRFFKLDNKSGKKGSGLGLAIAKEIVLSHKGRIWAESEAGVGSSFFIALPLHK